MEIDPLVGGMLGAYTIESRLGEGGMARVYKAHHLRLQREVAIKVILPQSSGRADFQQLFEQEARLVASLHHRNIVTVYDFGEDKHILYLVMQYVAGGTLRDQLAGGAPLDPHRAALYALQIARALHHAHQRNIVHRDVKPLNMLISSSNRNELLLSDFGLAKLFNDRPTIVSPSTHSTSIGNDQILSRVGNITGTPRYMAPEQCLEQPVDARTDIYALGVVLFEMLTGRPPFQAPSLYGLLHQHAYVPAPSVDELNPAAPTPLVQITARALAKSPADRFQSAREIGQALESWLMPSPPSIITLPPQAPPAPTHHGKHVSRIPVLTAISGFIVIVLLFWQMGLLRLPTSSPASSTTGAINSAAPSQRTICSLNQAAPPAQPFVETFQNDNRGWSQDSGNGISPIISANTYQVHIANTNAAFFLCPDPTKVGTLPANFTLSAQIAQQEGPPTAFYGLLFHFDYKKSSQAEEGYAFLINGQGEAALFRYDPGSPKGYIALGQAHLPAIHASPAPNTLQIFARGDQYTFMVNGSPVPFHGADQANQDVSDATYSQGLLGAFVSGPDAAYAISRVQLSVP